MNTVTRHYIDGTFVESHGREVMDIINPTNRETIAQVTLADEEDGGTARFSRLIIEAGELSAMQTQACKHSGVGREFGTFGIEAFLEPKAILE